MRTAAKTHPVLSGVLIEVNDKVTLTGSDLDKTIKTTFDAQIEEGGTALVPARTLEGIIKRVKDDVELSTSGQKLHIKAANADFEMLTISDEYPVLSIKDKEFIANIDMRDMINKGGIAAARGGLRPVLNSVYVEFDNIKAVSTDGHRMALYETGTKGPGCKYMIPAEAMQILSRIGDKVDVYSAKNKIIFETEDTTLISSVVDGNYLPYDSVIPQEFTCQVTVNKDHILPAIERALVFSDKGVRIRVNEGINIFAQSSEIGRMEEDIPAEVKGDNVEMSFNPGYLVDGLKAIDVKDITLKFSGIHKPVTITDNEGFTYIVMPIMVRED